MANLDSINSDPNRLGFNIPKRKKSKLKKFIFFILFLAILGGVTYISSSFLGRFNSIFTGKKNIFTRVTGLISGSDTPLKGEDTGIVNVLLLGIGGEGHDGANLTDTMIVASMNVKTNEVVLTSIPRDWFVTIPGHGLNKINAVYAYALQDSGNQDTAGQAAIAAAEKVTGFDIPYYALIDFKGFVTAVDHVGGVDITIDNTFTDSTFPNDFPFDTKGYLSPVTFTKGPANLNGKQALIFARSRHSSNPLEGSDFARSERQKKIIVAMKDKLTQLNVTNIGTLNNLLSDFTSNFRTNLEPNELLRLSTLAKNINGDDVYSLSLEPQGDLICDTTIDQLTGKPYIRPVTPTSTPTTDDSNSSSTQSTTGSTSTSTSSKTTTNSTPSKTTQTTPTPNPTQTPDTNTTPQTPTQIAMYIVEPCAGKTLNDIHNFLVDYWDVARLKKEGAEIEVQNSTGKTAASASWKALSNQGLDVTMVPFTGKTSFDKTILYDNTQGAKPKTLEFLREHESFTQADIPYTNSKADFVIILGSDALQ